ncbi:MAG: FtsW/RodA/SpoVE family cell cycle protein [Elusimicrobiota bacterium]
MESGTLRGRMDWALVISLLGLLAIGSIAILSAASLLPYYDSIRLKHFLALGIGIVVFFAAFGFNYHVFQDQSRIIYVLTVAMMLLVLFVGEDMRGTRAWIRFPFFSFQPSELARILTVLILASYLDRRGSKSQEIGYLAGAFAVAAPIMCLILLEPDFSSTLSFFPLLFGMLFCAGASVAPLLALTGFGAVTLAMPLIWTMLALRPEWTQNGWFLSAFLSVRQFGMPLALAVVGISLLVFCAWKMTVWMRFNAPAPYFVILALILSAGLCGGALLDHQIKGYQRDRFVAFLVPDKDPRGSAYNVAQAQIAIGSGGLTGKGIFAGTQSQLGFVPERHTDFIFAVVGEEMGFLGSAAVLALYMLLLWRIVNTARLARDRYGYLVCCGFTAIYGFYFMVNVGMCLGLVPVAGIQLPLLSYGGSNLVATLLAMGIVMNIYSKRHAFY